VVPNPDSEAVDLSNSRYEQSLVIRIRTTIVIPSWKDSPSLFRISRHGDAGPTQRRQYEHDSHATLTIRDDVELAVAQKN
jgi:hypothetical protein